MDRMTEGELWSWVRSVMSQGADIRCDYDQGAHKGHEAYSARLDAAAAERAEELWARLERPNVLANRKTRQPQTHEEAARQPAGVFRFSEGLGLRGRSTTCE